MADLSFQNRLQFFGFRLSKSEQKIAAYIVAHPEQAASIASQELAQAIGTSNSTLTRFCKKLDYRNYIEFQTLLAAEGTPGQTPDQTIRRIDHYYERTLDAACELVQPEDLDAFVDRIHQADKILIFGLGSSGLTASELEVYKRQRYERYGAAFGDRRIAMLRMKEVWFYHLNLFADSEKYGKRLRKAAGPDDFLAAAAAVFRDLPLREQVEPGWFR